MLEHKQDTVPRMCKLMQITPRALAKAFRGLGGERPSATLHRSQGQGHLGEMVRQGATLVLDPDMLARHPPPPPVRHGNALSLLAVVMALDHDTARRGVPFVPRPPAALPVPDGPLRAAASFSQPPEHVGAVDARLNGTVRPGAGPQPLARPCEPSATPPPPPPPPAHTTMVTKCRLCAACPREGGPKPPQP